MNKTTMKHSGTMDKSVVVAGSVFLLTAFWGCTGNLQQPIFVEAPGSPIAIAGGPGNVVIGDLNKDGNPDVIISCGESRSITIMLGFGNGEFVKTKESPVSLTESPIEMTLNDFDSDNNLDLAFASHDSYQVTILMGDGKGNFQQSGNTPVVMKEGTLPHTHGLASADFNGDGYPDLVTANNEDNDIAVVLNDGKGGFFCAPGSPFAVSDSPYPLTIGDLDHDGHPDIVVSSTARNKGQLTVMLGDGRGGFRQKIINVRTPATWYMAIGDVNADDHPDIVATHSERPELTVLLGDGKGTFSEVAKSPFDLGSAAWTVAMADVNGDRKADVIAAASSGVSVLLGDGAGDFQPATGSPYVTGKGTWRLAVDDLNNDGKPDVVATSIESNNVSVLIAR